MKWFYVFYVLEFLYFLLKYLSLFEIYFMECVGFSVFGIYIVEYFCLVYDKKSGFYVLCEV